MIERRSRVGVGLAAAVAAAMLGSTATMATARGDDAQPGRRVTWSPARPVQGTLITVTVHDTVPVAGGELAGEPLHFTRDGLVQRAVAAVPVDAADTVALRVDAVAQRLALPVARGAYRLERLRVAPGFGREPDSATAARMAREAEQAREVSRRAHETPRLWTAPFVRPRPGRVTSGYGHGREFNGAVQSRHMGTDLAGAVGAPVRAMNRGVVALVDRFYLGGNVVYVDHGAGLVSAYLHLSRTDVAAGDTVRAGQTIGGVGATGRVTGPHLHWIVRYGSVSVDAMSVFALE
jgi:murein DD-endopeptidase MepM/ murein hydrolase activator NlpD